MRGGPLLTEPDQIGTPAPLIHLLPAVLQEDDFVGRMTAGLDDALAPVISVLDCLDAYVDPRTCPEDFLDWLAGWVGVTLDENWPVERRRRVTAQAVTLYRSRGTVDGLRAEIEAFTGGEVTLSENGGTMVSAVPGTEFPELPPPSVTVRVKVDDPASVNKNAIDALVKAAKPAHVAHTVEVVGRRAK